MPVKLTFLTLTTILEGRWSRSHCHFTGEKMGLFVQLCTLLTVQGLPFKQASWAQHIIRLEESPPFSNLHK
jgi:hypothetical protein